MSRALSQAAKESIFSAQTDKTWISLLEINSPELSEIFYLTDNNEAVTHDGQEYISFPFMMTLPDDSADNVSQVTLTIDNVDRQIVQAIRLATQPPAITLKIVLAETPDTIEAGPFDMTLKDVKYNALTVSGTITYEDILNATYPSLKFVPKDFPGLF